MLIIGGGIGVVLLSVQIAKARSLTPPKTFNSVVSVPTIASLALPASDPTHISAPSVGIDADIIQVSQDSTGAIEMPPLFSWEAGWYKYSPTPGQIGPAIIVGHVDTYKGISVFWNLRYLKEGDLISVTRADGRIAKFKVIGLEQFYQNNFPTDKIYGNIKYPGLRLITCGGSFDSQTASYTENTVVFASMIF